MSLILRYTTGSTYTLVAELVGQEYGQELAYAYHIPLSDVSAAAGKGLSLSKITIKGMVETKTAVDWQHINGISLDSGTSYQTVVFSSVDWQDDRWSSIYPFNLTLVAYVQRVGASTRYPTSGYQWGAGSVTLLAHGGNANASPKITLLPPLLHFPLSQNLASYEGSGIVFTRAGTKTHLGIAYGVNAPIYDNGLYLASDTSSDVGVMTLTASTLKTIAMQIKQTRFPSAWLIGTGSPTNLVSNPDAETNTTGWTAYNLTLTRNTTTPLAGAGDFKCVATATGGTMNIHQSGITVIPGHTYYLAFLARSASMDAGRQWKVQIDWKNSGGGAISSGNGTLVTNSATAGIVAAALVAPVLSATASVNFVVVNQATGETVYLDAVQFIDLTALNGINLLTANQSNAETDTTGMGAINGTLTRNTSTPLAGAGDFKVVGTGTGDIVLKTATTLVSVATGLWYSFQALIKTSGCAAGRTMRLGITWYQADGSTVVSTGVGASVACPTTATVLSCAAQAPALAVYALPRVYIETGEANETLYADSLMLEAIPPTLTVWTAAKNKLTIDLVNNLLQWTDDATTVSATFPTALYMAGAVTDVVVMEAAAHAVTVIAHAAGGTWNTGTGTLAAIAWPALTLGVLEGSLANLTEYDYVLTSAEYQALAYSLAPWSFNTLRIPLRYPGTTVKDGQTLAIAGADHSGLLGGSDVAVGASNVTLTESGGIACRWFAELARTDTP